VLGPANPEDVGRRPENGSETSARALSGPLTQSLGLEEAPGPDLLTPREADVLELLQQGRSNSEIAGVLHVGKETVRTHARSIYRRLGVQNRRELASLAQRPNGELTRWATERPPAPTAVR
jgi:DNA-binding NarL/FixJ family response regulator